MAVLYGNVVMSLSYRVVEGWLNAYAPRLFDEQRSASDVVPLKRVRRGRRGVLEREVREVTAGRAS